MTFEFEKQMEKASDAELLKIVTLDRDDYQGAAVIAAENELARRNLTTEQIADASTANVIEKTARDTKANLPLDFYWIPFALIFPGIFQMIISGIFKGEGYDRKARELTKWTLLGLGFYILLTLVVA